jgi:hypothetical protein
MIGENGTLKQRVSSGGKGLIHPLCTPYFVGMLVN